LEPVPEPGLAAFRLCRPGWLEPVPLRELQQVLGPELQLALLELLRMQAP
jgi:hypothetical protein